MELAVQIRSNNRRIVSKLMPALSGLQEFQWLLVKIKVM